METEFRVNASGAAVSSCDLTNGWRDAGVRVTGRRESMSATDQPRWSATHPCVAQPDGKESH